MPNPKTPYQRIIEAARKGRGVRLSPDEVVNLSCDDAIRTVAEMDDENEEIAKREPESPNA